MIIDCRNCRAAGHVRCQCDDSDVLRDGQTIRVGAFFADSAAGAVAIRDYAAAHGVSDSQAAYEMRLGDAWKARPGAIQPAPQQHFGGAAPVAVSSAPLVVTGDTGQAAYEARLKAAWQRSAA